MKINLTGEPALRSEAINLGDAGEFHVTVKAPSYEELIEDSGRFTNYVDSRLKTCIVGWTGLMEEVQIEPTTENEEPKTIEREIPFTWDNFKKLCAQFPSFYRRCTQVANECYSGGAAAKNARPASGTFSADAVIAQMQARLGSTSAGLGGSPSQPDSPQKLS